MRNNRSCLPRRWIPWVLEHARVLLAGILCATGVLVFFTVQNFKINTDLTEMISNDLPFRQVVKKFHKEFPDLVGSIVVVLEGETPEQTARARDLLAERLRRESTIFTSVYTPGGGSFFDRTGLLYLSPQQLEEQGDNLAEMQPFLARLSEDFSLAGLFGVLREIVEQDDIQIGNNKKILQLFNNLARVFANVEQGKKQRMSWQELMQGPDDSRGKTAFIILQPIMDYKVINPAKKGIIQIREAAQELQLDKEHGVTISITGKPVISYADLRSVRTDIGIASLVSFVLVAIILYLGLGSIRLVFASLTTLMAGLVWTIGFAILLVGRLNMISVTFVVLFIGLGIDYSIQICLRYKEFHAAGRSHAEAITEAVNATANTLLVCSISTAIGFYAFVPTAYVGASELGLIAGTGMFIIYLAGLTILPAMMSLMPEKSTRSLPLAIGGSISSFLVKHPRGIVITALLGLAASMAMVPEMTFDANPFHLSDQRSEAVRTALKLFEGNKTSPWTISILAQNKRQAEKLAGELKQLPEVEAVVMLDSFIPKDQEEKLEQIEDMAMVLPPAPQQGVRKTGTRYLQDQAALAGLFQALDKRITAAGVGTDDPAALSAMQNLAASIHGFERQLTTAPKQDQLLFEHLEQALLPNLEILLQRLQTLMEATAVDRARLPGDLVHRYLSPNGLYRIQVFPRDDLRDFSHLKKFVAAVQAIAPEATDQPVTILGAGKTIVSAFRNASILAFILIALFLRLVMKTWLEVLLVLIPLLLALCYTVAAAVLLGIPFNFANIIVVPLLLGIGVDSSIHVIHRVRDMKGVACHILETSTSRAVLFSSLTTIMSFGSLSFMHHAGTASMGKLLTLSVSLMIFCTLILLPAYLELHNPFANNADTSGKK
ncbi:MAG: hopanoid biosynthesis-associated RND transporter HpnN [Desulfocapsa sp.]|nr:MAG: hopanoid biosynthesis-associated RND transporter HpnN [Desulfocapsa sp.]